MSRMRTPTLRPAGVARQLAAWSRELDPVGQTAALAVFGRFLIPNADELDERVSCLPGDAARVWRESLAQSANSLDWPDRVLSIMELAAMVRSDELASRIDRETMPVLAEGHLFEQFLIALNATERRRRGAFYTPHPIVRFILDRVERTIARCFPHERINLIDPACGYGAFLLAAREQLHFAQLTGCEVCPLTWAVAHLFLAQTPLTTHHTLRLLHTNSLSAGEALSECILGTTEHPLVPVIIGNPPWSNFGRQNQGDWISGLLADYRAGLAERKSNLADDAIKFIRWGQHWIDAAGRGILAFITPNTWLDGLTHRRMRESLLASFDDLTIVDLHGGIDETDPADENVFGVRSGAAIVVLTKSGRPRQVPSVSHSLYHADLIGSRDDKFAALRDFTFSLATINPTSPCWSFAARATVAHSTFSSSTTDYSSFWPLSRIFRQYLSGVQTKNDGVFVGFTPEELTEQVQAWLVEQRKPVEFDPVHIQPYFVAPFDRRCIYYDPRLLGRARYEVLRHMLRPNLALVFMRQSTVPGEYDHFLVVDALASDRVFYSRQGAPFIAPLWVEERAGKPCSEIRGNLDPAFVAKIESVANSPIHPLQIFHYLYAICHAPSYRQRYDEKLRRDFPRFPLPASGDCFRSLAEWGGQLMELHVHPEKHPGPGPGLVPAKEMADRFHLGGYDVIRRWHKGRRGRTLSREESAFAERLGEIGSATQRLAAEIDPVYRAWFPG